MIYPQIFLFSPQQGCFHIETAKEYNKHFDSEDDYLPIDTIRNEEEALLIHSFTHVNYLVNMCKEGRIKATIQEMKNSLELFKKKKEILLTSKRLPDEPGVYFIFDQNKNLIYVGKSDNLSVRIRGSLHERKGRFFKFAVTESSAGALIYEMFYIHKFQPKLNCIKYNDLNFNMPDLIFTDFLPANMFIK